ncbi:uncharacterized protein UV8b_06794 [Ustilaginoidea virens]|uniref:tRNA 4-demethylwyosine synthase (AdoMet-dependent) n=1 Tax=Ustilaginoidea virens TaxID=1159556 RepID=A0A8E5HWD8_USTVR|nr:uncharacterized protein UV8b_06794 [Ustilaginoidea virens]QUC22553.1 hypothetical protein UV8b_06794 [Ustilaginoidea virens]
MDPLSGISDVGTRALFDDIVGVWHEYRTPLILSALVFLLAVRVYIRKTTEPNPSETIRNAAEKKLASSSALVAREWNAIVAEKRGAKPDGPRRIKGGVSGKPIVQEKEHRHDRDRPVKVLVFFSSVTTKTEKIAQQYLTRLQSSNADMSKAAERQLLTPELHDLADVDFEDFFVNPAKSPENAQLFYLFLIPSYNIDTINDTLLQHLEETHHDFRIDTAPLAPLLGYSVFGFGDKEGWPDEAEGYCFQAKELDKWMSKLTSGKRAYPVGMGDMKSDHVERFEEWARGVQDAIASVARNGSLGEGAPGSGDALESDVEDNAEEEYGEAAARQEGKTSAAAEEPSRPLDDMEDLGRMLQTSSSKEIAAGKKAPLAVDFTSYASSAKKRPQPAPVVKEMVAKDSPTYAALTKQGYSIVGSHSGVKICRWTKSALRGRGSCYKYSLYGINSHQCMETTPSLSCSNKCVFCWRHGTNPVGTTWRWVVDPPDMIFKGVKENHYKKIKMMRGVPGVRAERYAEALRIRHCALSLVGEPIFYPYINEFLAMLHSERISSFLVCNAQHPDQLAALKAVTQLYVSIDAADKDSLRKIDRPLHRDFWERFQRCLDILRAKRFRHRTVFRLTLVKGFNVDDQVEGYARLVERGLPCFVEVKGVTYCGTSTSSNAGLSMSNVPFYWEVCDFVRALEKRLKDKGLRYGIAAEHAHSCCILLASERFFVRGKWHTHIDYQRFFELLEERGPDGDWTPEDYMGEPTPEWALWGNGGFDPRDDRVDRKGNRIENVVVREAPPREI